MTNSITTTAEQYLAEFDRGRRGDPKAEVLRIGVCTYRGQPRAEARIYYRDPTTGEYRPTKKGVAIQPDQLPEVVSALQRALELMGGAPPEAQS